MTLKSGKEKVAFLDPPCTYQKRQSINGHTVATNPYGFVLYHGVYHGISPDYGSGVLLPIFRETPDELQVIRPSFGAIPVLVPSCMTPFSNEKAPYILTVNYRYYV